MIDRISRDRLAEQIRHLVAGVITNYEYEDRIVTGSRDPAVGEIYWVIWQLYDDLHEHRLTGTISKEDRRVIARLILFLKSDLEYEYPHSSPLFGLLLVLGSILMHGILGFLTLLFTQLLRQNDAPSFWPFMRLSDYETALTRPPYLRSCF